MSNIIAKVEELKAQFGANRVQLVLDQANRQSIVALAKPKLRMDLAKWSERELREIPADKAGYKTRIVPIEGATHVGSVPMSNVQALGVARAGNNAPTVSNEIDMNRLVVKHFTYVAFLDNPAQAMNEEQIIQSQFGSREAFENCAFITFETLDMQIALGPVGMLRLTLAPEIEQVAIMKNYTKFGYKRVTLPDGTVSIDKNAPLVPQTFGPSKQLIFKGVLFVNDVEAPTGDGTVLSAFQTYRCGTNAENGEMLYQEGTYAQLERSSNTQKSVQEIASKYTTDVLKSAVLTSASSSFAKDVEIPTGKEAKAPFAVATASKTQLQKFLKENGLTTAQLTGKTEEELREMAQEAVELNA